MLYGLKEEDLQRIDKKGVEILIKNNKERLNIWSIPEYEKRQIREEIKQLEKLLKIAINHNI